MNRDVFISNLEIKELPITLQNKYQLEIKIFDLCNNETSFLTSLMKENEIVSYKKDLFKLFDCYNKIQIVHNPQIKTIHTILDEENNLVGLELNNGVILKNEIRFYGK